MTGGVPALVKSFPPPSTGHFNPTFLVVDTTGHVWFTDPTNNDIGELTISTNTWKIFTTGLSANEQPYGIVLDKHGNIWFTERAGPPLTGTQGTSKIGFLSPAASTPTVVETKVPTPNSQPFGMTYDTATDTVWFTEDTQAKIGNFVTSANGVITIH